MKIALVNLWNVNNSYGGTAKVFFDMANALSEKGHIVTAITHSTSRGEPVFPINEGVIYQNCGASLKERYFHNGFYPKLLTFFIRNRMKRRVMRSKLELTAKSTAILRSLKYSNPEVIVSFQQETTYLLLELLKVKVPIITMFHNAPSEYFNKPEFVLYKSALENCACLQVLMPEYIQESLNYLSPKNIVCIPNTVPQYAESSLVNSPVILNVGRIGTQKRQHLIVEAFAKLKSRYPDWKVELWGPINNDTAYVKNLKQLIKDLNLQKEVTLRGSTNDVKAKLKEASVFAFPSAYEGFSLALTEAMSMGLPAIGCRSCPSVNTLIKDGENGYLCSDSSEDIATKLEVLMKDYELRKKMGSNAKKKVSDYSSEKVWQQWEDLFHIILSK